MNFKKNILYYHYIKNQHKKINKNKAKKLKRIFPIYHKKVYKTKISKVIL